LSKIAPVPYRVLIKKLKNLGLEGPQMGSKHPYMTKGNIVIVLPNPHHGEDVDVKLIKEIMRVAGISRDEWLSA
jgi:predicted RNA binding protein YcfA (HicA-like mRNA interferase family)